MKKTLVARLFCAALLLLPAYVLGQGRPIQLRMTLPQAKGPQSVLNAGNYTIALQLRVRDAVAFVDDIGFEALVMTDPDDCIDMSHFSSIGPFEICQGGPDETYVAFRSERSDQPGQIDVCASAVSQRLIDDVFNRQDPSIVNKPYLFAGNVSGSGGSTDGILELRPVGAFTGGTSASLPNAQDCYGFGADDDLPGLVMMADIGPMRVFDENFNLVGSRIRNFAGMLNSVSIELLDRADRSAIVAFLRVPDGLIEPLTLVDRNVTDPSVDFMTRRDSGNVESFTFASPPANKPEEVAAILATFPAFDVKVRAVIVDGPAPEFIDDLDGNGRYTARDLQLAGYTLLSNQATLNIHAIQNDVLSEFVPFKCPAAILAGDLDGNGLTGYSCNTGNSRSIRREPK